MYILNIVPSKWSRTELMQVERKKNQDYRQGHEEGFDISFDWWQSNFGSTLINGDTIISCTWPNILLDRSSMRPTLLLYKGAIQFHILQYFLLPDMYLCQLHLALHNPEIQPMPISFFIYLLLLHLPSSIIIQPKCSTRKKNLFMELTINICILKNYI